MYSISKILQIMHIDFMKGLLTYRHLLQRRFVIWNFSCHECCQIICVAVNITGNIKSFIITSIIWSNNYHNCQRYSTFACTHVHVIRNWGSNKWLLFTFRSHWEYRLRKMLAKAVITSLFTKMGINYETNILLLRITSSVGQ